MGEGQGQIGSVRIPSGLRTRRFTENDLPRMSDFMNLFRDGDVTSARQPHDVEFWRWKFLNNPVGAGEVWLTEDGDMLIGTTSITPKKMKIREMIVPAAEIGDTFTHPDYQKRGIFTTLVGLSREHALSRGISFIYGTPNNQSLPPYERRCSFAQTPSVEVANMVRPVNMRSVLRTVTKSRVLATVASPFLTMAYALLFRLNRKQSKSGISITQVDSFPDEVEALWAGNSQSYDVIQVRDKAYLEWRYVTNPGDYTILVARRAEVVVGYMVAKTRFARSLRLGCVADFLILRDDVDVFRELLIETFERLRRDGVDLVYCWTNDTRFQRVLRRTGFLRYMRQPVICYQNELGKDVVGNQYRWYFTVGDSDNI